MVQRMDELIAGIAATQHGVFARAQARATGMTRSTIAYRLKSGRWHAITPRIYRLAGTPTTERSVLMATVLSAGGDAVATAGSALGLHGIRGFGLLPAHTPSLRAGPMRSHFRVSPRPFGSQNPTGQWSTGSRRTR